MEDANNETDVENNYHCETSTGEKRKREGKLRSKVWEHFTKLMKEDGTCEKCQCNHCEKLFTCSSRSGTTHLLRHITDKICPAFRRENKDKMLRISGYMKGEMGQKIGLLPWKCDTELGQSSNQQCTDIGAELLQGRLAADREHHSLNTNEDEHQTPLPLSMRGKLSQHSAPRSQPKGEAWMNEFRNCVAKLVELTNRRIPVGSLQALAVSGPDYSIANALKCLNEMDDIPQSSEMYLDAFDILQDTGERECFICLPREPRRRWLQRVLHRRNPLRYSSNIVE